MSNSLKVLYAETSTLTGVVKDTAVTAGTLLTVADSLKGRNPVVKPAEAKSTVIGVAGTDAKAGDIVPVVRTGVVALPKGTESTLAAGDGIAAGANGAIAKAAAGATQVGVVLSAVTATDTTVNVLLTL